ncbi:MAG TPA: class I SAM-dependent methyltransferase [Blastocatellia bacterium]|nr:class I SAM-dependent methyltransferase [Blastocatellia bacterium]
MAKDDLSFEDDGRYYVELAAAFVRGKIGGAGDLSSAELIGLGKTLGLRMHKFKRQAELPRVRRVLGVLQGLAPASLLDVGSGRGAFLWPLLDSSPYLSVIALDHNALRVMDIDAVRRGGRENLRALLADATAIGLADDCVDVVTALEVLEHMPQPALAAAEAVRVARNFVVASVPSKEDDNPEHIQLFNRETFEALWAEVGARGVNIQYVLNHMIAVVKV